MSILYKFDARTKLFFVLLLSLLAFLVDKLPVAVCLLASFIVVRLAVKVPFRGIGFLKNLSLLASFIIVTQTLFGPGENYIIKPLFPPSFPVFGGTGSLKWEGFLFGLVIVFRLSALFILLPVFTETTPPHQIASGLNSLGLNYRFSFIITTAFNLIPLFREEAMLIIDAQKLRGMRSFERRSFGRGSFLSGIKAYTGLIVPLMLGAMRKAQLSAVAMDSRAFGVYKTRTWLDKPRMKAGDFFFIAACLIFFAAIIFLNYFKDWGFLCPVL